MAYATPERNSCLHIAAGRVSLRAVMLLVDAGMNVNLRGDLSNTPLHYASNGKHDDIVEFLIDRGALPDLANEFGENAFYKRSTPLRTPL